MFLDGCQISTRLYTRAEIGRSWIVGPGRGPNEGKGFDLAIHVSQGGWLQVVLYLIVYPATSPLCRGTGRGRYVERPV
jgi:hypothetical protein